MTRIPLGTYPTPVLPVENVAGRSTLYVKCDDATSSEYGGNKVRKLEYFFGAAREAGKRRILTVGAVGSHQVVATAIFGARLGFDVDVVLVPQPASAHAEQNVRLALSNGIHATACPAWSLAPFVLLSRFGRDAYFVPLGGSNALGSLGFVDAALELADQVKAGALPEPDVVIVALGSGGTAAGLAVGFEKAKMKTRVIGVAISHPAFALGVAARRLAASVGAHAGLSWRDSLRAARRVEVDGRWVGRGYGYPTKEGVRATDTGARAGITLDPTYTAKAFACALDAVERGRHPNVLFWNTVSSAAIASPPHADLPKGVARLLR